MDDLIADFVAECREMLEALGGEVVAWEAQPDDRARLDSIFRFVHTVKGNCGFFEFPRLEALSHAAEDALADVRAGRRHPDGSRPSDRKASRWEREILDFAQDPGEAVPLTFVFPLSALDALDLFFIFVQEKARRLLRSGRDLEQGGGRRTTKAGATRITYSFSCTF